jgi:hypothetical protein
MLHVIQEMLHVIQEMLHVIQEMLHVIQEMLHFLQEMLHIQHGMFRCKQEMGHFLPGMLRSKQGKPPFQGRAVAAAPPLNNGMRGNAALPAIRCPSASGARPQFQLLSQTLNLQLSTLNRFQPQINTDETQIQFFKGAKLATEIKRHRARKTVGRSLLRRP